MQCPECLFENREGRSFCARCGTPLTVSGSGQVACPRCGFQNEAEEKFCGGCGMLLNQNEDTVSAGGDAAKSDDTTAAEIVLAEDGLAQTQTVFRRIIDDRRRYPRLILRGPGKVLLAGGKVVDVTVHDIAPDGLQIRCSRNKAILLYPEARSIPEGKVGAELQLVFTAPLRRGRLPVRIVGRLIFFALINPNLVALGLKYAAISLNSRKILNTLIKEALEPRALRE